MESEYDEWFKLEKEKLEKLFHDQITKNIESGSSYEREKVIFEKRFKKLFRDYEEKNYRQIKFDKWKKLLMKPIKEINKGMDEFIKAFRE